MSIPPSRPSVPRPTPRATSTPPAPETVTPAVGQDAKTEIAAHPAASEPPSGIRSAAFAGDAPRPPTLRDRMPTPLLELAEDDLIDAVEVVPAPSPAKATVAPPPSPAKVTVAPPPPPAPPPPVPLGVALASFDDVASRLVPEWEEVDRCAAIADPTDLLFELLYELNFVHTATNAATFCAEALSRALGARAVLVHKHDEVQSELRIIGAYGPRTMPLVNTTEPIDLDLLGSAAACNGKPVTMIFDDGLPRSAPRRLRVIGVNRSLVAVPAMVWNRCVAMIEVIDPDERLASRAADAASYVAKRLAEYLVERAAA